MAASPDPETPSELHQQVAQVIERIRPAIQEDGGDVELVDIDEAGTVRIRFKGACIGCPSSEITLRDGLARNLRESIPEVREVIAVE